MTNKLKEERTKEFINCLGNGKSIYQCEDENNEIDEELYYSNLAEEEKERELKGKQKQ